MNRQTSITPVPATCEDVEDEGEAGRLGSPVSEHGSRTNRSSTSEGISSRHFRKNTKSSDERHKTNSQIKRRVTFAEKLRVGMTARSGSGSSQTNNDRLSESLSSRRFGDFRSGRKSMRQKSDHENTQRTYETQRTASQKEKTAHCGARRHRRDRRGGLTARGSHFEKGKSRSGTTWRVIASG